MDKGYILIINENTEEIETLQKICKSIGPVYPSSDLEKATNLLDSINFNVVLVDHSLADYSSLKGLIKKTTSVIITGNDETEIKEVSKQWPLSFPINYHMIPRREEDVKGFLRILKIATEHSQLRFEVERLNLLIERADIELNKAQSEIKEINNLISSRVKEEIEKRLEMEKKFISSQREKQKIEEILKKLYTADDVTSLLDIVYDIKEIVHAESITMYILDESEILGKYLKPLVWNNSYLSDPDFSKYIVLINSQDFAAEVARTGQKINTSDLSFDKRLSKRYLEHLNILLKNILCVPIMYEKKVIGVLEVYNKMRTDDTEGDGFKREDNLILRRLSEHIAIAITKLNLIQYDALTGLLRPNPFFDKVILKLKSFTKRSREEASYAIVMGDVDWFKNYNDRNGHEAGNRLLRELAYVLKTSIREKDLVCRYGGEEFLFFLSGTKDMNNALRLTERIRKNVEEHYFENQEYQPRNNLTMSFGITCFSRKHFSSLRSITQNDLKNIANEADMALAEAKGKKSLSLGKQGKKELSTDKNTVCAYYREKIDESEKHEAIEPSEENSFRERRKFERFYTATTIVYRENTSYNVTKTINLSLGGARISTESEFKPNKTIDLILILEKKVCHLQGDVVYSEISDEEIPLYNSGLKFKDLTPAYRRVMEDYFSSLRKGRKE